jgi:hypothetical protein
MTTLASSLSLSARGGVAAASLAMLAACGGTVERAAGGTTTGGDTTGGNTTTASSTGTASSSGSLPVAPAALVRFANLATAPAPGPSPFDVCSDGGGETALLAADGLTTGLGFGGVSRYLPQVSGTIWRLVSPGSSCSEATAEQLAIDWPAGSQDARVTIVPRPSEWGTWASAYAFVDEPVNDQYGINVRVLDFIGLAPSSGSGPSMTVLQQGVADAQPTVLFSELHFASVPTTSPLGGVTSGGFVHTPNIAVGELLVVPNAYVGPLTFPGDVPIPGGSGNAYGVASIFLGGRFDDGSARAVVCDDNSPAEGGLTSCTVLAPMK